MCDSLWAGYRKSYNLAWCNVGTRPPEVCPEIQPPSPGNKGSNRRTRASEDDLAHELILVRHRHKFPGSNVIGRTGRSRRVGNVKCPVGTVGKTSIYAIRA